MIYDKEITYLGSKKDKKRWWQRNIHWWYWSSENGKYECPDEQITHSQKR